MIEKLVKGEGCVLAGPERTAKEVSGSVLAQAFSAVECLDATPLAVVMGPRVFADFVGDRRAYRIADLVDDGPEDGPKGTIWGAEVVQRSEMAGRIVVGGDRGDGTVVRQAVRIREG